MNIFRKMSVGLMASFLVAMLSLFGLGLGLLQVFGSADSVKGALASSGIYQSFVGNALEQTQKDQTTGGEDQIPLDKPEVQNIIKTAASPDLLQSKTENALDSVYAWLHGDTPNLEFNLETADIKTNLATGIEQYLVQHIASLPACAPGTAGNVADDPFNATCRPEGIEPSQIAGQAKGDFLNSEFLKNETVSANDIKTDDGQTLAQKIEDAPSIYKSVSWGVYGSGILAALLAVGIVLLSATWRSGVKKVSITFIVIGALDIVLSLLIGYGIGKAGESAKEPLQQSGIKVAEALAGDLRSWWLWYGVGLVVAGVAALVALHFLKSQSSPEGKTDKSEPTGESLPSQATRPLVEPKPTVGAKPPRPEKKLVQ